jgi:hypothetical protein
MATSYPQERGEVGVAGFFAVPNEFHSEKARENTSPRSCGERSPQPIFDRRRGG